MTGGCHGAVAANMASILQEVKDKADADAKGARVPTEDVTFEEVRVGATTADSRESFCQG